MPEGISGGTAFVDIRPSFGNFTPELTRGVQQAAQQAGTQLASGIRSGTTAAEGHVKRLGSTLSSLAGQAGPVGGIFTEFGNKVALGFDHAGKAAETNKGRIVGALGDIAIASAGITLLFEHFAKPLEESTATLKTELKNAGVNFDDVKGRIEAATKSGEKFGFGQAAVQEALAKSFVATHDFGKSLKELPILEEIAKANHLSLQTVVEGVNKAYGGSGKFFKQFGDNLKLTVVSEKQVEEATKKHETAVTSLTDAQQKLADFEERTNARREQAIQTATDHEEQADQKLADSREHLSQLRQDTAERDAEAEEAFGQKALDVAQRITDAEQNLADTRTRNAETEADAERQLAEQRTSALQSLQDAEDRLADTRRSGAQSVHDAEQRLRDLQERNAARGNPAAERAISQRQELRHAREEVANARQKQGEDEQKAAEGVTKAREKQGEVERKGAEDAEKRHRSEAQALTAAEKGVRQALEAQTALGREREKLNRTERQEQDQIAKAVEAEQKATVEMAKAEDARARAGQLTVAEVQQERKLREDIARKKVVEAEDQQKLNDLVKAQADNTDLVGKELDKLDAKYKGVLEAQRNTFSGHLAELETKVKDFLARIGEQLLKNPLTIVGGVAAGRVGFGLAKGAVRRVRGRGTGPTGAGGAAAEAGGEAGAGAAEAAGAGAEGLAVGGLEAGALAGGEAAGVGALGWAAPAGAGAVAGEAGSGALFGPVGLGITASIAGLTLLYAKWKPFHDLVNHGVEEIKDHWRGLTQIIAGALGGPVVAVALKLLMDHWDGVKTAAATAWHGIQTGATATAEFLKRVWHDVEPTLSRVWDGIKTGATTAWHVIQTAVETAWTVLKPIFAAIKEVVTVQLKVAWAVLSEAVKIAWAEIRDGITIAWTFIKPIFEVFKVVIGVDLKLAMIAFRDVVVPLWDAVKTGVITMWHVVEPILKPFAEFLKDHLPGALRAFGRIAKEVWDDISHVFRTGVKVVGGVLGGIFHAAGWVADKVGAGETSKALKEAGDKLSSLGDDSGGASTAGSTGAAGGGSVTRFARGGTIGGGFTTDGPRAIVGEGNPRYPEFVIPTDPRFRDREFGLYEELGKRLVANGVFRNVTFSEWNAQQPGGHEDISLMASGGLLGGVGDFFKDSFDAVRGAIGDIANLLKKGAAFALEHVWPKLPVPDNLIGLIPATGNKLRGAVIDALKDRKTDNVSHTTFDTGAPAIAGSSAGVGHVANEAQVRTWLSQALTITGKPAAWLDALYDIAIHESSGNPNPEDYHDSNFAKGTPSKGLMQVIGPTFDQYKLPGHNNILDPVDNAIAAIRYIAARYGDPSNTPGERSIHSGGAYKGYAEGGVLADIVDRLTVHPRAFDTGGTLEPGLNLVRNSTGSRERLAAAGAAKIVNYNLTLNNPVPETASVSLPRELRRAHYLSGN